MENIVNFNYGDLGDDGRAHLGGGVMFEGDDKLTKEYRRIQEKVDKMSKTWYDVFRQKFFEYMDKKYFVSINYNDIESRLGKISDKGYNLDVLNPGALIISYVASENGKIDKNGKIDIDKKVLQSVLLICEKIKEDNKDIFLPQDIIRYCKIWILSMSS